MNPMLLPGPPFELELARTCARLVLDAYGQFDQWDRKKPAEADFVWRKPAPPGPEWTYHDPLWATYRYARTLPPRHARDGARVAWVDRPCPVGFLATAGTRIVVVFRGTQTGYEWTQVNLRFLQRDCEFDRFREGRAHAGFLAYYKTVGDTLARRLAALGAKDKEVVLTGHSLGGALATLAAHDLADEGAARAIRLYTFGAPRVFDPRLARAFESLSVPAYRIVNVEDAVTTVPLPTIGKLSYQHIGIPVSFSAHYNEFAANHAMAHYGHAVGNPHQPQKT